MQTCSTGSSGSVPSALNQTRNGSCAFGPDSRACQGGSDYVVVASAPLDLNKPAQAQNCLMYDEAETNIKCTLSDKAARLAIVDRLAVDSKTNCVVKDRRFVGESKDNSNFFEAACQDGKGYIIKTDARGQFVSATDCAKASNMLGGCTLTDSRQALTEQAALYTRLAKAAGSNCDVDKYALFPAKTGEEDVELVCKDGRGAIALFRAGGAGSQVLDCARAPIVGFRCSMTNKVDYSVLTADLKKLHPDTTCQVSDSRVLGKTQKGTTLVEVACADKLKGYVIEYQSQPKITAVDAPGCAFAGNCKLPGNS